jgi:hypothetical protein
MDTAHKAFPILWIGPAGSGKLTAARKALGVPSDEQPRLQTLEIGDYFARYWEFTTHMEIDIMDLSMMDKQILPEMLTQLLSTRDVTGSGRKMMILRHIHGLSPAAATRLRACLEELVWQIGAPAMVWCTARVVNSVVSGLMDGFVYRRVPGAGGEQYARSAAAKMFGANSALVPSIQSYISEMLRQMVIALDEGPPCLAAAGWIRGRVYDLLGLMITGTDLVAGLTWATVRLAASGMLSTPRAVAALDVLARSRWVPSYRIPLVLELIVASVYNALIVDKSLSTVSVEHPAF